MIWLQTHSSFPSIEQLVPTSHLIYLQSNNATLPFCLSLLCFALFAPAQPCSPFATHIISFNSIQVEKAKEKNLV